MRSYKLGVERSTSTYHVHRPVSRTCTTLCLQLRVLVC